MKWRTAWITPFLAVWHGQLVQYHRELVNARKMHRRLAMNGS